MADVHAETAAAPEQEFAVRIAANRGDEADVEAEKAEIVGYVATDAAGRESDGAGTGIAQDYRAGGPASNIGVQTADDGDPVHTAVLI